MKRIEDGRASETHTKKNGKGKCNEMDAGVK